MAYSETDPLLPNDRPAPEISDYGSPAGVESTEPPQYGYNSGGEFVAEPPEEQRQPSANLNSLLLTTFTALVWAAIFSIAIFPTRSLPQGRLTIEERADKILSDTPLIDGHIDLALALHHLYGNHIYQKNFTGPFEGGGLYGHVDLPRLRRGKVGGAFWSAYVACPKGRDDLSDDSYAEVVRQTYQQLDVLQRLLAAYPIHFSPTPSSSSALTAFAQGRLISPFGIEGLHQIGNSPSILRSYYGLGARYATLTHNCHNIFADAALTKTGPNNSLAASKPLHGGLSSAGVEIVKEMNRMGMIVDLSHVSHDTMSDVLGGNPLKFPNGSAAPTIFSHSSSYALCPHPRNVPDSLLSLVKSTNSLIMVNFNPDFVSCTGSHDSLTGLPDFYPANSTIEHVVTHIKHIGDLIGYAHVGLGSDFDGIPGTPRGLNDVSKYPALVAEMLRQGVSDEGASKVVGGNMLRVWRDVEAVAERLQREGQRPMEDDLRAIYHPPKS
ncbi:MAG: hypothetical protein M1839_006028 [Geoglossum umbratile]|nr:MAG: hypothetical protein M1839_006028 [Geoglossum umbratile]